MKEIISRTQDNEWYVGARAQRSIGPRDGGDDRKESVEAYVRVDKKDVSLVDVDHELSAIVRLGE